MPRAERASAHRHIGTSAHRHIGTSAHRHIGTSAHRHIGTSAHRHIGTSAHRHIGTSAHRHIGTSAHRHINEDNAAARRFRGWPCASREVALAARRGTRFRPSQHAGVSARCFPLAARRPRLDRKRRMLVARRHVHREPQTANRKPLTTNH
ncbi:hypothetical protein DM49_2647 [Burkholderia mallei]|nr:hypothetical protein DM49_2647 [Burkholderia mallei]